MRVMLIWRWILARIAPPLLFVIRLIVAGCMILALGCFLLKDMIEWLIRLPFEMAGWIRKQMR